MMHISSRGTRRTGEELMKNRRLRWLALVLPLGLLAAACGDDDDSGGEAADTTAAEAATTAGGAASGDFTPIVYDESAQCGTAGYEGNVAKLEAVDELTFALT